MCLHRPGKESIPYYSRDCGNQSSRHIKKKCTSVKDLGFNPSLGVSRAIFLCNFAEPLIPYVDIGLITLTLMSGCKD